MGTSTSGKTCTPTLYCQEELPCTQVLLIVCRRRSQPLLPAPSRSRSSPHKRENTPAGSEDLSLPHSPHSNRCGSPRQNMTSLVHPLYTGSASKHHLHQMSQHQMSQHHITQHQLV